MLKFLITPLLDLIFRAGALFAFWRWGVLKERNKDLEKDIRTHEKVKDIHNRVDLDSDYRLRVRREYDGS